MKSIIEREVVNFKLHHFILLIVTSLVHVFLLLALFADYIVVNGKHCDCRWVLYVQFGILLHFVLDIVTFFLYFL